MPVIAKNIILRARREARFCARLRHLVHLPPPDTKRWTARRKASVVAAVLSSIITIEEVCQRYGLSVDEFRSWHNAMQRHGLQGLRITKLQNYRYSRPK